MQNTTTRENEVFMRENFFLNEANSIERLIKNTGRAQQADTSSKGQLKIESKADANYDWSKSAHSSELGMQT